MNESAVLDFWFDQLTASDWFNGGADVDVQITEKFSAYYQAAVAGELADWRDSDEGRLAEIIVLDQFSRNIFRNQVTAFAADMLALGLAQEAVRAGADNRLPIKQAGFLLMPFMHSESAKVHAHAEVLFNRPGMEGTYEFELKHKVIIDRFGRYPHRNQLLSRVSSAEELEFLKGAGSSF